MKEFFKKYLEKFQKTSGIILDGIFGLFFPKTLESFTKIKLASISGGIPCRTVVEILKIICGGDLGSNPGRDLWRVHGALKQVIKH